MRSGGGDCAVRWWGIVRSGQGGLCVRVRGIVRPDGGGMCVRVGVDCAFGSGGDCAFGSGGLCGPVVWDCAVAYHQINDLTHSRGVYGPSGRALMCRPRHRLCNETPRRGGTSAQ